MIFRISLITCILISSYSICVENSDLSDKSSTLEQMKEGTSLQGQSNVAIISTQNTVDSKPLNKRDIIKIVACHALSFGTGFATTYAFWKGAGWIWKGARELLVVGFAIYKYRWDVRVQLREIHTKPLSTLTPVQMQIKKSADFYAIPATIVAGIGLIYLAYKTNVYNRINKFSERQIIRLFASANTKSHVSEENMTLSFRAGVLIVEECIRHGYIT